MRKTKKVSYFLIVFLIFIWIPLFADEAGIQYEVQFSGIQDKELFSLLQEASQLIKLKKHSPRTEAALKRRIERDIPNLIKALHSQAYYNAQIKTFIDEKQKPTVVFFAIDPGPIYPIAHLNVYPESFQISPEKIGLSLRAPARTVDINIAEEKLMLLFSEMGYPLAKLAKREVIADQASKEITINLYMEPGPLAYFGATTITGNDTVKTKFIKKKIDWRVGEIYDPSKINATMNNLESAGVFSAININESDTLDEEGFLPMNISVSEGKHRSIGLGVGYSTQRGPGVTAEWEHRNFHGMGEQLRVNLNALEDTQETTVSYLIPDFLKKNQDLLYAAEVEHDRTKGFEMTCFSLSATIERQFTRKLSASYGGMFEVLKSTKEKEDGGIKDGTYNLAKFPLKGRFSTIEDVLDPLNGGTLFFKTTPTVRIGKDPFVYAVTLLTASTYKPLSKDKTLLLAGKISIGSIWGASRSDIPGSERYNAGSENLLRGYNYETVSPLSRDGDPMGGRSLILYNLELRFKLSEKWGGIFFYDAGNVFSEVFPKFNKKMLQSIGTGIRYFTPVGPLRLDFAYPLDRRRFFDRKEKKHHYIDDPFQIYFSVGQSF